MCRNTARQSSKHRLLSEWTDYVYALDIQQRSTTKHQIKEVSPLAFYSVLMSSCLTLLNMLTFLTTTKITFWSGHHLLWLLTRPISLFLPLLSIWSFPCFHQTFYKSYTSSSSNTPFLPPAALHRYWLISHWSKIISSYNTLNHHSAPSWLHTIPLFPLYSIDMCDKLVTAYWYISFCIYLLTWCFERVINAHHIFMHNRHISYA